MPAAKSSKKTETIVAPEPVVEKKTAAKKAAPKKTVAKKQDTPVVEPVAQPPVETTTTTTEVQNVVVASDVDTSITDSFTEFIARFQGMVSQFSALKTELKNLEKKTVKQLKVVQKLQNKRKRKGTRAPSGFVKPSPISNELAQFLGKPEGSEMARTDVTREINKYIRANNLQDKENGRKINPDKQLCQLLKITDDVNLTYFNLQRYMGPHFPKQAKTETAA